jgi:hypothetical protein
MSESLVFVLPDGRSARIPSQSARLICDRLWQLGIMPGASLAAARIAEGLRTHPMYRREVAFSEREVSSLLEASNVATPRWSFPYDDQPLEFPDDVQSRLLDTCEGLIETLSAGDDHLKLRALIADLERLRDRLRGRRLRQAPDSVDRGFR